MEYLPEPFTDQWQFPGFVQNELWPSQLTNCTIRKKCERGGDGKKRLRIRNFLKAPTRRRTKKRLHGLWNEYLERITCLWENLSLIRINDKSSLDFWTLMTILTVATRWILALKLNYCISGNKYKGINNGETDSKKYQSMDSGQVGYKRKTIEDIPRRREGSMVILYLSDKYWPPICMSRNL